MLTNTNTTNIEQVNIATSTTSLDEPDSAASILSVDRLTVCFTDPNEKFVFATAQLIWDGNKHGIFPVGSNVQKTGPYQASVSIPFAGKTAGSKAKAFFQAGPNLPGHPSYRL